MGRKGVSKRKPKTKSKANSSGSSNPHPSESSTVQSLVNKHESNPLKGGQNPASGSNKTKRKGN
jgi:hypothetical protein